MNEKKIKVTDKRLFTADGELREEYRDLQPAEEPEEARRTQTEPPGKADATETDTPIAGSPREAAGGIPSRPTFLDLVATVAQPIALYLGDVRMPDGESVENLQLARLHIDLLEVLKTKSAGNLSQQEEKFLEDLLYELRLRYVEKSRGGLQV